MSTEQIEQQAMALPPEKRAELAERLLASLEPPDQREIDQAWEKELEARIDAYERGEQTARPAEEVIREIRQRLGQTR